MKNQIITINDQSFSVSAAQFEKVETFSIGERVKILMPNKYDDKKTQVCCGVVVSFDNFTTLPTITIMYIENDYTPEVKLCFFNSSTENVSIVKTNDDFAPFEKAGVVRALDTKILAAQLEVEKYSSQKAYFLERFGTYFDK